jgi:hypothetical protein
LGLRPHEFESRILRHLTRGNAVWPRFVGRARLDLGPKLVSSGTRDRVGTDVAERQRTHVDGARACLWTNLALRAIPRFPETNARISRSADVGKPGIRVGGSVRWHLPIGDGQRAGSFQSAYGRGRLNARGKSSSLPARLCASGTPRAPQGSGVVVASASRDDVFEPKLLEFRGRVVVATHAARLRGPVDVGEVRDNRYPSARSSRLERPTKRPMGLPPGTALLTSRSGPPCGDSWLWFGPVSLFDARRGRLFAMLG